MTEKNARPPRVTVTSNTHDASIAVAECIDGTSWVKFTDARGFFGATIFCPPAVAEATAGAFNAAMQAERERAEALRVALEVGRERAP
jgi:hypothetical protein